jgi:hypothetical protein
VDFLQGLLINVVKKHTLFLMTCAYLLPAVNHPKGAAGWISPLGGFRA